MSGFYSHISQTEFNRMKANKERKKRKPSIEEDVKLLMDEDGKKAFDNLLNRRKYYFTQWSKTDEKICEFIKEYNNKFKNIF